MRCRKAKTRKRSPSHGPPYFNLVRAKTFAQCVLYRPETYETGVQGHSKHLEVSAGSAWRVQVQPHEVVVAEKHIVLAIVLRVRPESNRQLKQRARHPQLAALEVNLAVPFHNSDRVLLGILDGRQSLRIADGTGPVAPRRRLQAQCIVRALAVVDVN